MEFTQRQDPEARSEIDRSENSLNSFNPINVRLQAEHKPNLKALDQFEKKIEERKERAKALESKRGSSWNKPKQNRRNSLA